MNRQYAEASHCEEPGARIPHAGICEGAVQVTGRPTSTQAYNSIKIGSYNGMRKFLTKLLIFVMPYTDELYETESCNTQEMYSKEARVQYYNRTQTGK